MHYFYKRVYGDIVFSLKRYDKVMVIDLDDFYTFIGVATVFRPNTFKVTYFNQFGLERTVSFFYRENETEIIKGARCTDTTYYYRQKRHPNMFACDIKYRDIVEKYVKSQIIRKSMECFADVPEGVFSGMTPEEILKFDTIFHLDQKIKKLKGELESLEKDPEPKFNG